MLEQPVRPLLSDSHLVMGEEKEVQFKTNDDNELSALETILSKLKSICVSELELKVSFFNCLLYYILPYLNILTHSQEEW